MDAIVTRAAAAPVETSHAAQLAKLFGQVAAAPLGDTPLAQIGNAALRMLVDKMQAAGLAPKTIVNYSQVVKLVLASALTSRANSCTRESGITISSECRLFWLQNSGDPL